MLSQDLMNILACPVCKGELSADTDGLNLLCRSCELTFPIREDIPIMLIQPLPSKGVNH